MAAKKNKRWAVVYEAKTTKSAANPKDAARTVHEVAATDKEHAVQQAKEAQVRTSMRLTREAEAADSDGRTADAKFLRQRADIDDYKLLDVIEIK